MAVNTNRSSLVYDYGERMVNYTGQDLFLHPDFKGPLCDVDRIKPCKEKFTQPLFILSGASVVILTGFVGLKTLNLVRSSY